MPSFVVGTIVEESIHSITIHLHPPVLFSGQWNLDWHNIEHVAYSNLTVEKKSQNVHIRSLMVPVMFAKFSRLAMYYKACHERR